MTVISEPGLYKAILQRQTGRMEGGITRDFVKRFQRWVTHEVLPQIRRTGGYIPTSEADDDMTILAKAVMIGQRTMEEQKQRIAAQQSRIDELQPKASAWDNFVDIPDALSVRDSAKLLSNLGRPVGQTELFEWLDRHDWIFRENKHWSARQSRINAGHLMMVPSKSHGTHKDGTPFAFPADGEGHEEGSCPDRPPVRRGNAPARISEGGCVMPVDNSLIPCRIDKPNPFEAMFALIYMGVGAFCLIAGLRRMERWEILFGFAMLMIASQASNRFLARKRLYEDCLVFCKPPEVTQEAEGKMPRTRQADGRPRKEALK